MMIIRMALTMAAMFFATCFIGLATVEYDRVQSFLKTMAVVELVTLVSLAIYTIWTV